MHYVAVVPADLQSAGIKYKDLFNPLVVKVKCFVDSIQCNTIDNNLRSARTTLLLCRRICAPPELNIRIFDPITSYLTSLYIFNAKLSLDFSLFTS